MGKVFALIKHYKYVILFLILMSLALVVLQAYRHEQSAPNTSSGLLLELVGPFQKGVNRNIPVLTNGWQRYVNLVNLKEENQLLMEIIEELKQERIQLIEARTENSRLRELLSFKQKFPEPLLPAQVIGKDLTGWFQTLVIDRGKRDGIEEGMAVLTVQGIVGQIMESSQNFSRVLLITDPNSSVAALVQRTRARGVVEGNGIDLCRLKYLHRSETVEHGDLVLSSGLDRLYPKGLLIGTVFNVHKKEAELFQDVLLRPAVNFQTLEEVVILCKKAFQEDS